MVCGCRVSEALPRFIHCQGVFKIFHDYFFEKICLRDLFSTSTVLPLKSSRIPHHQVSFALPLRFSAHCGSRLNTPSDHQSFSLSRQPRYAKRASLPGWLAAARRMCVIWEELEAAGTAAVYQKLSSRVEVEEGALKEAKSLNGDAEVEVEACSSV